jgi:hypothetical protein
VLKGRKNKGIRRKKEKEGSEKKAGKKGTRRKKEK